MISKPTVYISCQMIGDAVEQLHEKFAVQYRNSPIPAEHEEFVAQARKVDVLISFLDNSVDAAFIESAKNLKIIANVAVGYDNIDVAAATARGILVLNTPGVLTNATADLTFALLLAAARRVVESDRFIRAGKWVGWSADLMLGRELYDKTLGIVGMGRIGRAVAKRAAAFGMSVVYTRRGNEENDSTLRLEYSATRVSFGELLARSDFITVHTPLSAETRHLIGKTEFGKMKPECIFINTARGAVIDQDALVAALQNKQIAGAALDVFDGEPHIPQELVKMENVVLAPHIGSATIEARAAMSSLAVNGVLTAFSGELPQNAVNPEAWPSTPFARKG